MVHTDGGDIGHPEGYCGREPGMARYDSVGAVDQNGIDKAKFRDAGGDLFDLPGRMSAGVFKAWFERTRVLVFDGQRRHSALCVPKTPSSF
jgi:hypothetical protein